MGKGHLGGLNLSCSIHPRGSQQADVCWFCPIKPERADFYWWLEHIIDVTFLNSHCLTGESGGVNLTARPPALILCHKLGFPLSSDPSLADICYEQNLFCVWQLLQLPQHFNIICLMPKIFKYLTWPPLCVSMSLCHVTKTNPIHHFRKVETITSSVPEAQTSPDTFVDSKRGREPALLLWDPTDCRRRYEELMKQIRQSFIRLDGR